MAIKSFKEFQSELNQARLEKHKQELKFRADHKAGEQQRVVNNILNSLGRQIKQRLEQASVEPVSASEYSHSFDCITKDDIKQVVAGALSQIEFELIQAGYKFEADVEESSNGYQLTITLILDVQDEPEVPVSEVDIVTLGAIFTMLLNQ